MEREKSFEESDALERRAYEQVFGFDTSVEEEAESDYEESSLYEGMVAISLSKEEKARIRKPWGQAIIVKKFEWKVGFLFLSSRLRTNWMPVGRMDCIDIGNDFFLIKFELQSDLQVVLKGGPWYVGQHFLAIRKWELEFKAEEASLSFVAVWIRLPGLPIEFYDLIILKKIGRPIGLVLRIDTYTANGHCKGNCPALIRSIDGANKNPSPSNSPKNSCSAESLESDQIGNPLKEPNSSTPDKVTKLEATVYDEWMVVMRRKKPNGNGRTYFRGSNRDDAWG
ncbi:uncharacterized protein LOC112004708 [Quercus suber]|uniref:uncharacterized protein LOC112004708 n=1 Tax=Quercus suber TaxID=58331 RepID=UPI000CE199D3|nr:uncharacterized protein LOC112004708 [Quercus suber]